MKPYVCPKCKERCKYLKAYIQTKEWMCEKCWREKGEPNVNKKRRPRN